MADASTLFGSKEIDLLRPIERNKKNVNLLAPVDRKQSTFSDEIAAYDEEKAVQYALGMGLMDTFRGVKQLADIDRDELAADQRILNALMENPEWGGSVKAAWLGGMIADPVGWLIPYSKFRQLGKAARMGALALQGMTWGGVSGYLGYVDKESSDRLTNALFGAGGGTILGGVLGGASAIRRKVKPSLKDMTPEQQDEFASKLSEKLFPDQPIQKRRISETEVSLTGKTGETVIDFTNRKTAKELLKDPQATRREFTGEDGPTLSGNVKSFYYNMFQPARKVGEVYGRAADKYVYKPLILENPVASIGAGVGGFTAYSLADEPINRFINRVEDERDLDTGPWRAAMISAITLAGAAAGFGGTKLIGKTKVTKEAFWTDSDKLPAGVSVGDLKTPSQKLEDWFGRRIIDNYKLDPKARGLKQEAFMDVNSFESRFTQIANRAKKLSPDEKTILYQFLDGQPRNLSGMSDEVRSIASDARKIIQEVGQLMVDSGMLKESTYKAGMNSYIHRTYRAKLGDKFLKGVDDEFDGVTRAGDQLAFKGMELMSRGHSVSVRLSDKGSNKKISDLIGGGYTKFGDESNGIQVYRRQLTPWERKALGEIEDAAFAIKSTGELMTNDLAAYKYYDKLSKELSIGGNAYSVMKNEEKALWKFMPDEVIEGTGLKKYGNLSGRYLPKDIADDIIVQSFWSNKRNLLLSSTKDLPQVGKVARGMGKGYYEYKKLLSLWKRTKTSWNPTVHTNNTLSNFVLLDAYNVSVRWLSQGVKVFTKKGQESLNNHPEFGRVYDDLTSLGVLDASLAKVELQLGGKDWTKDYAKEFLNLNLKRSPTDVVKNTDNIVEASVNIATKTFKKITDIPAAELAVKGVAAPVKGIVKGAKAYDDWATKIYAREDQMFRVALYMDRMEKGVAKLKALNLKGENYSKAFQSLKRASAQEARKGFIDYDIKAPFINALRDLPLPFFSYTYRIIPILAETAIKKPHKFAKWAAIGYAIDYAGKEQADPGEVERMSAVMSHRDTARAWGLPFMPHTLLSIPNIPRSIEKMAEKRGLNDVLRDRFDIALSFGLDRDPISGEELPKTSKFMNTNRFLPGADVIGQTTPDQGGVISSLPAPFQPSFGLLGELFIPLLTGIDPFSGKKINPDDEYILQERVEFIANRLVPNNPVFAFSDAAKELGIPGGNGAYFEKMFNSYSAKKISDALEKNPNRSLYADQQSLTNLVAQSIGFKIWDKNIVKDLRRFNAKYEGAFNKIKNKQDRITTKLWRDWSHIQGTPKWFEKKKEATNKIMELATDHAALFNEYKKKEKGSRGVKRRQITPSEMIEEIIR